MKAVGIIRTIDELGRVVIPMELRRVIGAAEKTPMEIFVGDGGTIILKKYEQGCTFCGGTDLLVSFMGKQVCAECRKDLQI